MASTGVLPFVRGVDFTLNDLNGDKFPTDVRSMSRLRWLHLNKSNLDAIPDTISTLDKLEHLSCVHNAIKSIPKSITGLSNIRVINFRDNQLINSSIPPDLFSYDDLSSVDLSCNQLKEIPIELENARSLTVLNLGHNNIENIPNPLFVSLSDLIFLDLSYNKIDSLPPQMRRLVNLQTLLLNNNPLALAQLRFLPALISLRSLNLSNTQRTITNLPTGLDTLVNLEDVNISENDLPRIPEPLFMLKSLRRLDVSSNNIDELPSSIDSWPKLEFLNVSRNQLTSLPNSLCRLTALKRLYLNSNKLDFQGIPAGIGKLSNLQIFSAANNNLETIPEGLCRCGKLQKLILNTNRLITLPEVVHLLTDLQLLDVKENHNLVMPPKPSSTGKDSYYNIDFSLNNQLRLAGAAPVDRTELPPTPKDHIARKVRLQRRNRNEESDKVLKGMRDVAKHKAAGLPSTALDESTEPKKPKRWDENLTKPELDYTTIFDDSVGQIPGVSCWEIENFLPNQVDDALIGKFYEADCYIVLKTFINDSKSLDWQIYYWIGDFATLDKKACAAIHAVNLRNLLGAECRTIRQEMNDEDDEFLELFDNEVSYIEGGHTTSGFFSVEDIIYEHKLYRVSGSQVIQLHRVPVEVSSLDHRYVYLLDIGVQIYIWVGVKSKNVTKTKCRLIAEKISKIERKNEAMITVLYQRQEIPEFWSGLGANPEETHSITESQVSFDEDFIPKLYKVGLGNGYLELPQVELPENKLVQKILDTKSVYILDCSSDIFVWIGKKSARLVRAAALKLSQELCKMLQRPSYATVSRCLEGTESQVFKTKFVGWDDVLPVDFTRTADSITRRGADLKIIMERDKLKTDLSALFQPRSPPMSDEDAEQLMQEWNDDLDGIESFVLEGKKFVRLPEEEFGHFHEEDCYVFLCRYWVPADIPEDAADDEELPDEESRCTVYFWQGRYASNMGWLTYTFSLQKKFELYMGDRLEVCRLHQQQESLKFLSHFKSKFIIHRGKRKHRDPEEKESVKLYYLRANYTSITARCIQISTDAKHLNSYFCYILCVPFGMEDPKGIVYIWIGSKSSERDARISEQIAYDVYARDHTVQVINEGEEPENFFWVGIGGKKPYESDADFMTKCRLFRCSNEKGYFTVSEKCADFCQDDLSDEDVMILDNGQQVFLWVGRKTSDVEIKLAFKSSQVYVQHLRNKDPDNPRKLLLAMKHKEDKRFTKCFHGWAKHREVPT